MIAAMHNRQDKETREAMTHEDSIWRFWTDARRSHAVPGSGTDRHDIVSQPNESDAGIEESAYMPTTAVFGRLHVMTTHGTCRSRGAATGRWSARPDNRLLIRHGYHARPC